VIDWKLSWDTQTGYPSDAFLVDVATTYDIAIAATWLSGTEEVSIQLINWIIDGTIPVDYHLPSTDWHYVADGCRERSWLFCRIQLSVFTL
jgi:hypothetical protein